MSHGTSKEHLPRADGRWTQNIYDGLVDDYQLIATKVIIDWLGEVDSASIADSGHIDTTILELVDESLIVIGSHT